MMTIETPVPPVYFPDVERHFFLVVEYLRSVGANLSGSGGPIQLPRYKTIASPASDDRPNPSNYLGQIIFQDSRATPEGTSTYTIQYSDGSAWQDL